MFYNTKKVTNDVKFSKEVKMVIVFDKLLHSLKKLLKVIFIRLFCPKMKKYVTKMNKQYLDNISPKLVVDKT